MTKLPADLEALMPKASLFYRDMDGRSPGSMTSQQPVFTADQVREAMLAATERAAKVCDSMSGSDYSPAQCATAIRGSI